MIRAAALLGAGVMAIACGGPDDRGRGPLAPPRVVSAPPPSSQQLSHLAGAYTLTIDLAESCTNLPEEARRRVYQASMGTTQHAYLSIQAGGTVRGDLWPFDGGRVRVNWNNFDVSGCDGVLDTLPDGRSLMICGDGPRVSEGSTISGPVQGSAFIQDGATLSGLCSGAHRFTFTRATSEAASR